MFRTIPCPCLVVILLSTLEPVPVACDSQLHLDLRRAKTKVPRDAYRGNNAQETAATLNSHLLRTTGLRTRECAAFDVLGLRQIVEQLHGLGDPQLLAIYRQATDARGNLDGSLAQLRADWANIDTHVGVNTRFFTPIVRDGLCHAAVMQFAHHIAEAVRRDLLAKDDFVLPLLPPHIHTLPLSNATQHDNFQHARTTIFRDYKAKVSCQQCHSGKVDGDASLPKPLPVDKEQPGLERLRSCDYQNVPACGPCDGLGGPRTGDGVHQFAPINCEVVALPEHVSKADRVDPAYPKTGMTHMVGDTRWPLVLKPDGKGKYFEEKINVSFGWGGQVARMRYDFDKPEQFRGYSQTYVQTYEQMRSGTSVGATIMMTAAGKCTCDESQAGVLHYRAFAPDDEFDVVDLPASEGGDAYLGRVRVTSLDDGIGNRTVLADHYLKYGFHFLADADKKSPTYGLPVRTYIPFGVRQVFRDWDLTDPAIANPKIWEMPKDCEILSDECKPFLKSQAADTATLTI